MIDLEKFIAKYTLEDTKELEHNDPQFLALKRCWESVGEKDENLFLYLVIECAIVSYQLSGTGEQWRTEAGKRFFDEWKNLYRLRNEKKDNGDWWFEFLKTSKYNKRIYNIKKSRIDKLNLRFSEKYDLTKYQDKLNELNNLLAKAMKCKISLKTIVFAIKMFGYACTIISGNDIEYPMNINIPVDSRIKKIYKTQNPNLDEKNIVEYFENLSKKFKIPPLDLDALLWLEYRNMMK